MTTKTAICIAAGLGAMTGYAFAGQSHGDPYTPIGTLDVDKRIVRSGTKSALSWNIEYPKTTSDFVEKDPDGGVTTKVRTRVQIRVAGVAFQSGNTHLPVAFWVRAGRGNWKEVFYGRSYNVRPDEVVFEKVVEAGASIDLAARARQKYGGWYDVRWTVEPDSAVIGLVNGETVPDYAPAYSQGRIEDFLSSYVNADQSVNLGPRDMIYLFELASRDPGDWYFDMQDLVVVITFSEV